MPSMLKVSEYLEKTSWVQETLESLKVSGNLDDDREIIEVDKMSEVLSSTEFIPCPNGFFHPETYRLYEALECETIPIVENAFNYYDRLFPGNPFIKVDRWIEAKEIIEKWKSDQIKIKREECKNWWKIYKNQLQNNILKRINS